MTGQILTKCGLEGCYLYTPHLHSSPVSQVGDYYVELDGQRFTKAQWEAVQTYVEGRIAAARSEPSIGAALDAAAHVEAVHTEFEEDE